MDRSRVVALCLVLLAGTAAFAGSDVVDTSVCDVLANPVAFNGKIIRLKGKAIAGFDEFVIDGSACKPATGIWLSYPAGTKAKAGPAVLVRLQFAANANVPEDSEKPVAVTLQRDRNFERLDSLLATRSRLSACLACPRYRVTATFVGRLDGSGRSGVLRDESGLPIGLAGYGNANLYTARLVIRSVADVEAEEIDYSKEGSVRGDARRVASDDAASLATRGAAAFGEQGEDNGVIVEFGVPNEIPRDDGMKGSSASPDGVLFHVIFDMSRLGKEKLSQAIAHAGTHIADIRGSVSMSDLTEVESRAWRATFMK